MKLSTAYRKLMPHTKRWCIQIEPGILGGAYCGVSVRKLRSDVCSTYSISARGMANAMSKMAELLDRHDRAEELEQQARLARVQVEQPEITEIKS